jgi:ribonuclease P protein component
LKRLLREAFRLQQADIPEGLDLVLIPRQASDPTLGQFQASLLKLSSKLSSKVSSKLSGRESEGSR